MTLTGCRIKITGENVVRKSFDSTVGLAGKEIDFSGVLVLSSTIGLALGYEGSRLASI